MDTRVSTVQAHRGLLVFQEDRFQPSSGLVDGGEDVAVSLKRSGQGPHYVHMNVGEMAVGYWNSMDGCCWLSGNFGSVPILAVSTLAGNFQRPCHARLPGGDNNHLVALMMGWAME